MNYDLVFCLENVSWPALVADAGGIVFQTNKVAVTTLGSMTGAPLSKCWAEQNESRVEDFLATVEQNPSPLLAVKLRGHGGQTIDFLCLALVREIDGKKIFVLQFFPGISAAKSAPVDVLAQKQKLDCALQLARTVSLDFNNALTSILGHTSLVLGQMEPNHPWRRSLVEVEKSAAKAAEIASDLGTFSRQEKEMRAQSVKNMNQLVKRTVEMLQSANGQPSPGSSSAAGQQITWTVHPERQLYAAKFDEAKMQQAFQKIFENALQAINGTGGRISVQTKNLDLTEPTQDLSVRLAAGCYVCVEISDNGCGIAPDVLPRIFEPFFTTKRQPHRGLGLAWVYGIITNHGGGVAVSSQPGVGTSVRIYLPAERRVVQEQVSLNPEELKGNQTILMVDDEDLLLTMGETILSSFGYRVLTANSGQRALEIISKNENPIHLIITDLVMPNMSGRELVEQLGKISPETRIICTSGYVWPSSKVEEERYLQKPFTSQELLTKVKRVLMG